MKVQSVGTKLYTYKAGSVKKAVQNPASIPSERKENEDKAKKKKILIGAGVAALTGLLLLLFRKKIFCRSRGTDTPEDYNLDSKYKDLPFDPNVLLDEFRKLCLKQKKLETLKTNEEIRIWHEQNNKIQELYNTLKKNNISLIMKEEFDPNPAIDRAKKEAYFNSWKVKYSGANEASKMDYLEMFEKYGDRYYNPEDPLNSAMITIASSVTSNGPTSDKVLRKYIDLMDKIAIKDSKVQQDVVTVNWVLENNIETMSEETVLKFIEVMKKIAFEQREGQTADTAIYYSKHKNSPKIKAALNDFIDSLKDYPYDVPVGG